MFFVEVFLIMNFAALCAILVVLWQIRDHIVRDAGARQQPPLTDARIDAAPPR